MASSSTRLRASACLWLEDEPGDVDLELHFLVPAGITVRVHVFPGLRLLQRLNKLPSRLVLEPADQHWRLRVVLGLSRLQKLLSGRADAWLLELVWLEPIAPGRLPHPKLPWGEVELNVPESASAEGSARTSSSGTDETGHGAR